jgi:hypothetical protein
MKRFVIPLTALASCVLGVVATEPPTAAPPDKLPEATSADVPELFERANQADEAIRWYAAGRQLQRSRRFADRGAIDLFVASSANWDVKADDARVWESMIEIGRDVFDIADVRLPPHCPAYFKDLAAFRKYCVLQFVRTDEVYSVPAKDAKGRDLTLYPAGIMAAGVTAKWGVSLSLVLARGDVTAGSSMHSSIVFATGNIKAGDNIGSSLIVCDGDVDVRNDVTSSIVIARGDIRASFAGGADRVVLIAGGKVTVKTESKTDPPVIKENDSNPLRHITFFELSRVGVKVSEKDKVVRVTKFAADSPLLKAGVAVDDILAKVNGTIIPSAEELRRTLRDALATKGEATLTVRRGEKTTDIRVPLE